MSRHRNFQGLERVAGTVLDEYDGYEEEEIDDGITPEDRQQLAQGAIQVREVLGEKADKVTAAQIQEALWHYYYDIDKTADYLTRKFISPPAPKPPKKNPEGTCLLLPFSTQSTQPDMAVYIQITPST